VGTQLDSCERPHVVCRRLGREPGHTGDEDQPSGADLGTRDALIDAFTRLATERGYAAVRPEDVDSEAALPPGSFAREFETKEQCVAVAYDAFVARLMHQVLEAMEPNLDWPHQVKEAVRIGLGFTAEAAPQARFFAVDALTSGGLVVLDRYMAGMQQVIEILRVGREHCPDAAGLPLIAEPVLVGGIASVVTAALMVEEVGALAALEREMVTMLLTPYVGKDRAEEIAE
jgi:AcrR family transcriptional regulator